jgi:hypothetical protein
MVRGMTTLDSKPSSAAGAEIRELAAEIKFVLAAAREWSEAMSNVSGFGAGRPSPVRAVSAAGSSVRFGEPHLVGGNV